MNNTSAKECLNELDRRFPQWHEDDRNANLDLFWKEFKKWDKNIVVEAIQQHRADSRYHNPTLPDLRKHIKAKTPVQSRKHEYVPPSEIITANRKKEILEDRIAAAKNDKERKVYENMLQTLVESNGSELREAGQALAGVRNEQEAGNESAKRKIKALSQLSPEKEAKAEQAVQQFLNRRSR